MDDRGLIFDIKRFSVNDGPGIRTTVFFKGCPLTCWWCHNPESRSSDIEHIPMTRNFHGREFHYVETVGRLVTVDEVMAEITQEVVFYESSGGGVTFSGGEPLLQPGFLKSLARACKVMDIHTCLDTCGYCDPLLFNELIPEFDLFLYDLKVLDCDKHTKYMGYPNDDILTNLQRLDQAGGTYIIRVPWIPGVNDDEENIAQLTGFLHQLINPLKEIHFLPYHPLARHKLKKMGLEDKMDPSIQVNNADLHKLVCQFQHAGYTVKIGG